MMDRLNVYFVYSTGQLLHVLANGAIAWFLSSLSAALCYTFSLG